MRCAVLFLCACSAIWTDLARGAAPELHIEIRGPSRIPYDAIAADVVRHDVEISMHNTSLSPVRLGKVNVRFEATRNGVEVPCERDIKEHRDVSILPARSNVTFIRTIDCAMPLVGTYEVRTFASWQNASEREIGTLRIE